MILFHRVCVAVRGSMLYCVRECDLLQGVCENIVWSTL